MSQIRQLVRDVWYTLQTTDLGVIRIAARIVAAKARDAAHRPRGPRRRLGPDRVNVNVDDILTDDQ
jgi:hypothetical protein